MVFGCPALDCGGLDSGSGPGGAAAAAAGPDGSGAADGLKLVGGALGLSLGVNLVNALVLGILGLPGLGLLVVMDWALAV